MRYLFVTLSTTFTAFFCSGLIMIFGNPEVNFWHEITKKRDEDVVTRINSDGSKPVIIFGGGSSCAFSIKPEIITSLTGRESINRGLIISAGMPYIVSHAFEHARAGDTVVLGLERNFLVNSSEANSRNLGIALALRNGSIRAGEGWPLRDQVPLRISTMMKMRLGARFVGSMLGKSVLKKDLYRYDHNDYRFGGRLETDYVDPFRGPSGAQTRCNVTSEAKLFLREAKKYADDHQIELVYMLPWVWTEKGAERSSRKANERLLQQLSGIIETLETETMGVQTEGDYFSDTAYHLTSLGASKRSEEVGKSLAERFAKRHKMEKGNLE